MKGVTLPVTIPRCDFCSKPEVWARHPAQSFTYRHVDNLVLNSGGDWVACQECATLVGEEKWDALLLRAVHAFRIDHPDIPPDFVWREVGLLQKQFRDHRRPMQ
jgi:hypothetical protein